ncbi:gluconokinase [uncultured Nocardioides sp.]|uniref:gluconokinase n=1 Tax=uncultured Nocardioides sp. TaxID=198441 RepID=UPI0025D89190|nr:gluconokinase [uncultured Nocardioides sp.]
MSTEGQPVWHLVFMGVSGSGKSTAALAVQERLGWEFAEGDDFHPAANIEKMSAGYPLTDADREPWLASLAAWTRTHEDAGTPTILSCSALKRVYRDVLRTGGERTFFVHLHGDKGLMLERMGSREHFMPSSLLESQLDALEPIQPDEDGMLVDPADAPAEIAGQVLRRIGLAG